MKSILRACSIVLISSVFLNFKWTPTNFELSNKLPQLDSISIHPQYFLLKKELFKYEKILAQGGWDSMPFGKVSLIPNEINSVSITLKKRLGLEEYLPAKSLYYPDDLINALRKFQLNNGLIGTGILDTITINTLNIPVEQRIKQLKINIERWICEPFTMGKYYLFVNAADFSLKVIRNDSVKLQMKIIVGRTYRPTPVFHARLTHLIFNPTWNIPPTILKNDILPILRKNRNYLKQKHIRVFRTKDGKRYEISTRYINWKTVTADNFHYELIEDPGPSNPLGVVKFMFPNGHDVYMHDTPSKELFKETDLTFSSGCIRLSKAIELANYLLKNTKGWDEKKINKTIKNGKTLTVLMPEPIEVYIEYFTAWVNELGELQFRKDFYNKDLELE